jgi:hypothetical protein
MTFKVIFFKEELYFKIQNLHAITREMNNIMSWTLDTLSLSTKLNTLEISYL